MKTYSVYMIRCEDGSYYTGYAVDPQKRFELHIAGKGAKYTRSHKPLDYIILGNYETKGLAMSVEYSIKQLSHKAKESLYDNARTS